MNLLIDPAPESVAIAGNPTAIRTDFRIGIQFEVLMSDRAVPDNDKLWLALNLYYPKIPNDTTAAVEQFLWFYQCGKDARRAKAGQNNPPGKSARIYDYEYDDGHIFSAFLGEYGIDLEAIEHLHWWKFKALFSALRHDNPFCRIMQYRAQDLAQLKGEERKHYAKMQRLYALPIPKGEQEKNDSIAEILMNGGDLQGAKRS